jgi:Trk K+ transport system NAD-binding subunit
MTVTSPLDDPLRDHVIVCGLGHVGYRCLCLLSRLGERAVVITREAGETWRVAATSQFTVLVGDARDERLLCEAGIARAKAIIVVTDDDLANVSIALDARRLNPALAITVRLFDNALAAQLEKSVQIDRALSASALAAPAFVAAALGRAVRCSCESDAAACLVDEHPIAAEPASSGKTIREWTQRTGQAVIALQRGDEITLRPEPALILQPGDRLTVLSVATGRSPASEKHRRTVRLTSAVRVWLAGVREWWQDVPAALRTALIALLGVVALSVGVFHVALDMPVIDAFYFVITTVTTVGYGDYSFQHAPGWMKLYGSFVMVCGAAIIATLFSIITDLILGTRFRDVIARGCARFEGHIIVVGLGSIGFRVVRELVRSGETVVAIEQRGSGEFVPVARELGSVVLGNARTEETLRRAGIVGAKAIVAATDDDLANLSIALAAKRAHPACRVVLRLFDAALAEKMRDGPGIDAVLSVSTAAAPTFVGAALCPGTLQGIVLGDWMVAVFGRIVRRESTEIGRRADRLGETESALLVRHDGAATYRDVPPDYCLQAGDQILGVRWYHLRKRPFDE